MFKEQATTQIFLEDLLYTVGGMCVLLVVAGLTIVDAGLSRAENVLTVVLQRLGAILISGLGVFIIGYALWNWQFYQAFGVKNALWESIQDWWLGGPGSTEFAQNLDPAVFPFADVQQVFIVFFATFGMATIAVIHSSVVEKIQTLPLMVLAAIVGLINTGLLAYLAWGSAAYFTNRGVHDLEGVLPLYVFCGTTGLILNWRLGPRPGAFEPHPSGQTPINHNKSLVVIGVFLIMFGLPFIALASGYIVPDVGFLGISMTTSGFGIVVMNAVIGMCVGGLIGLLLAARTKNGTWVAFGPIAGIIAVMAMLDVAKPWKTALVAIGGPIATLLVQRLCIRFRIDDLKIVPLGLGAGLYGAIMVGFVEWGTPTGGYIGITEGPYAFQHAEITPWWQLVGVGIVAATALVTALPLALIFEKLGRFRIPEEAQIAGMDAHEWNTTNYEQFVTVAVPSEPVTAEPSLATEEPSFQ
jgi:ammonia channel protein AmtB